MAVYSCNYPIDLTLGKGTYLSYTLSCGSKTFFEGKVALPVADTIITDVQSVIRHKLMPDYLPAIQNTGNSNVYGEGDNYSMMNVSWMAAEDDTVTSAYSGSFIAVYDYNTDYEYPLANYRFLNDPISSKYYYGQKMFICYYNTGDSGSVTKVIKNLDTNKNVSSIYCSSSKDRFFYNELDAEYTFQVTIGNQNITGSIIDGCYDYAIYYINKFGGLDTLLLGKCIESWSASRTGATLYNNRADAQSFENIPLRQQIVRQLACNTILLTNEEAEKIDHLVFTPRAWIYDIQKDLFQSVIIDTSSMTRKYSRYDKAIYYSFTVKFSQYQWR